jgi:PKHD-type hydroxylase
MIKIYEIFTQEEALEIKEKLLSAEWVDGKLTAGQQSSKVKSNFQLDYSDPIAKEIGKKIIKRINQNTDFISFSLLKDISCVGFNNYKNGAEYGWHTDNPFPTTQNKTIRADLSATLFLSDDYEGGELCVDGHKVKGSLGEIVVYPSRQLHRVTPVTKGSRIAAFFWIESRVSDHEEREILYQIDLVNGQLFETNYNASVLQTNSYNRLLGKFSR